MHVVPRSPSFLLCLVSAAGAFIADGQGVGAIRNDDRCGVDQHIRANLFLTAVVEYPEDWGRGLNAMGRSDVLHGTLDLLVLKALQLGPLHGYAIGQRISQFGEDVLRVEEGTLYPALYRLESHGWISSLWARTESNRRARYYKMTPKGRRHLAQEQQHWRAFIRVIGKVVESA